MWWPLKPLKTTVIAQKIQLLSVLWHFWSTFLTSLISYSEESFNPPCTCYYLSIRCGHTSPTAGGDLIHPTENKRWLKHSRYPWSTVSALPCNFVIPAQLRRGPWAQIGLPGSGRWEKGCEGSYACLTARGHKKTHPWLRRQNAFRHRNEHKVQSGGLLAFAHFIEWLCERVGGKCQQTFSHAWQLMACAPSRGMQTNPSLCYRTAPRANSIRCSTWRSISLSVTTSAEAAKLKLVNREMGVFRHGAKILRYSLRLCTFWWNIETGLFAGMCS